MDHVFGSSEQWKDNILELELDQVNQTAFLPYYAGPSSHIGINNNSSSASASANVNKRMIEFARRTAEFKDSGSRFHRRKMSERLRRENERKAYSALHSMLPLGTKNEKKSIMQTAARRIEELKVDKEVAERRNHNLQVKLEEIDNLRSSKIEVRVANANAVSGLGIDYIVEVLKCLNMLGVKTRSIQSTLSDDHQLLAVIHIQTQIPDGEVRKAVQRTLQEIAEKLQFNFPNYN
ncbi:transcription factor bHLH92 [Euphorbia lathyris]|uniref:transcription factor bHLH92 n=1 Tax=Euphorbia lathyris TaxID=212925 RepID=UPI0033138F1E